MWPVELAQTVAGAVMGGVDGQPVTLTAMLLVLSPLFASGVVLLTVAVLLIVVALPGAVTLIVITGALASEASAPCVQVIVVVPLQLQLVPDALLSVTPAGSVSVTVTSAAAPAPPFETVRK